MELKKQDIKESLLESLREVFSDSDSKDPEHMRILVRKIPILCINIVNMGEDIKEIKEGLKDINSRNETYVREKDFAIWRNILIVGLLSTIAAGVIMNLVG